MTTELVLLLAVFAFVLLGVFTKVPRETFANSGPRLGAHIERHLATGTGFRPGGNPVRWEKPNR